MADKVKRHVTIAGVRYTLSGDAGEEHLQKCADMVDKCMTDIQKGFGTLPDSMVAVLAACNIADQYLRLLDDTSDITSLQTENERLNNENQMLLRKLAQISNSQMRNKKVK